MKKEVAESDILEVKCYSGYTYAERPESFIWRGIEYKIVNIEKEWFEPGEKHFKVHTDGNKLFKLCYNEKYGRWSLIEQVGD